jgi:hypothetical protein
LGQPSEKNSLDTVFSALANIGGAKIFNGRSISESGRGGSESMMIFGDICEAVVAFFEEVHDENENRAMMMTKGSRFFIVPIGCMIVERI